MRRMKKKKLHVIVVVPDHKNFRQSDIHLQLRPGPDCALCLLAGHISLLEKGSMMNVHQELDASALINWLKG